MSETLRSDFETHSGIDRRDFLRKSFVLGLGSAVAASPIKQLLASENVKGLEANEILDKLPDGYWLRGGEVIPVSKDEFGRIPESELAKLDKCKERKADTLLIIGRNIHEVEGKQATSDILATDRELGRIFMYINEKLGISNLSPENFTAEDIEALERFVGKFRKGYKKARELREINETDANNLATRIEAACDRELAKVKSKVDEVIRPSIPFEDVCDAWLQGKFDLIPATTMEERKKVKDEWKNNPNSASHKIVSTLHENSSMRLYSERTESDNNNINAIIAPRGGMHFRLSPVRPMPLSVAVWNMQHIHRFSTAVITTPAYSLWGHGHK